MRPHHAEGSPFHTSAATLHGLTPRERNRALAVTLVRSVGVAVAILVVYGLAPLRPEDRGQIFTRLIVIAVLIVVVLVVQVRGITRAQHPGLRAVESLSLTVSLMVTGFASTYVVMSHSNVAAFSEPLDRVSALYFTMTTLATIGYGDIHARTDASRIVVMVQMVFNVALLGAGVRLITTTARAEALSRRGETRLAAELQVERDVLGDP